MLLSFLFGQFAGPAGKKSIVSKGLTAIKPLDFAGMTTKCVTKVKGRKTHDLRVG